MEVKHIFGIDLGTTYSAISYLDENLLIQTCSNENGDMLTPSVVDLHDESNHVVGSVAKDNKVFYPYSVLDFFKCEMGKGHEVKYYGENFDKETNAIELSSKVLKHLAEYAQDSTDSKVSVVVITVPAYFGTEEKAATKEAAEKAGFESVHLIEEPTAAAVYYGYKGDKNETVLVYDLGGGTFDVVAVAIDGYNYDCFEVEGDQNLGGKNWDKCMVDIINRKIVEAGGDTTEFSDEDIAAIQLQAENAKKALTPQDVTSVKLRLDCGKYMFDITREEFEKETLSLLDRTIETTRKVKANAESKGHTITKILLVGGSSYMPQVKRRLTEEFSDIDVPNPMDPNLAVSKGAAYYGKAILSKIMDEVSNNGNGSENGEADGESTFVITEAEIELAKNNEDFVLAPEETINIKKISVSSIGILGKMGEKKIVRTLLKRGSTLPDVWEGDIPLNDQACEMGSIDLRLYEHRKEEIFVDHDDDEADLKELEKKTGEITKGLPKGSKVHITLSMSEEGLLKLTAVDPNGKSVELTADTDIKSGN